jgi:putative membrane protein
MFKYVRNFLNGLAFGVTETIPGVSGGTIAIILGFYFELIEAINRFTKDVKKYLRFLTPLIVGMLTGILVFFSIINYLLSHHSLPTMAFFIGLIVGIIPLIHDKVREPDKYLPRKWPLVLIPVVLLVVISNIKGMSVTNPAAVVGGIDAPYMLFIFVAGIVGAAALVIPGISGSFVLMLLGIYPLVAYSVANIPLWLADIRNMQLLADICKVLVPLGIGIIIGGLSMVRLIEKLLKDYHLVVYSIILGLLLGSVYSLFRQPIVYQSGTHTAAVILAVCTFLTGCFISYSLGRKKL